MPDPDRAFVFRERCGCVSAVTVEDNETFHHADTLAGWKRRKYGTIAVVSVETAREALGKTFALHPLNRRGRRLWVLPHLGAATPPPEQLGLPDA